MNKWASVRLAAMFDELIKLGYVAPVLPGPAVGRVGSPVPAPKPPRSSGISGAAIDAVIKAVPNQKPAQPKPVSTVPKAQAVKASISLSSPKALKSAPAPKAPSVPKPQASHV